MAYNRLQSVKSPTKPLLDLKHHSRLKMSAAALVDRPSLHPERPDLVPINTDSSDPLLSPISVELPSPVRIRRPRLPISDAVQASSGAADQVDTSEELATLRYTAFSCAPHALHALNFRLRYQPSSVRDGWSREQNGLHLPRITPDPEAHPSSTGSPDSLHPSALNGDDAKAPPMELVALLTLSNHSATDLLESLTAIHENVSYFCRVGRESKRARLGIPSAKAVWSGEDAWRKFCLVVVVDGHHQLGDDMLLMLEALGLISSKAAANDDESLARTLRPTDTCTAHMFESHLEINRLHALAQSSPPATGIGEADPIAPPPLRCIVVMTEACSGLITSEAWFFGLCSKLQPRAIALLEAGLKPNANALFRLWKKIYKDGQAVACVGRVIDAAPLKRRSVLRLADPLRIAKQHEVKMVHQVDSHFSSAAGCVVDGDVTFACYRYAALEGQKAMQFYLPKQSPVEAQANIDKSDEDVHIYLKETTIHLDLAAVRAASLASQLVFRSGSANLTRYDVRAIAHANHAEDRSVSKALDQHLALRMSAMRFSTHSSLSLTSLWHSRHTIGRKFALQLQVLLANIAMLLDAHGSTNLYAGFNFVTQAFLEEIERLGNFPGYPDISGSSGRVSISIEVARCLYLWCCLSMLTLSVVGDNAEKAPYSLKTHRAILVGTSVVYVVLMIVLSAAGVFLVVSGVKQAIEPTQMTFLALAHSCSVTRIALIVIGQYGMRGLTSLLNGDYLGTLTDLLPWILTLPVRTNVLGIWGFARSFALVRGDAGSQADDRDSNDNVNVSLVTGGLQSVLAPTLLDRLSALKREYLTLDDGNDGNDRHDTEVNGAVKQDDAKARPTSSTARSEMPAGESSSPEPAGSMSNFELALQAYRSLTFSSSSSAPEFTPSNPLPNRSPPTSTVQKLNNLNLVFLLSWILSNFVLLVLISYVFPRGRGKSTSPTTTMTRQGDVRPPLVFMSPPLFHPSYSSQDADAHARSSADGVDLNGADALPALCQPQSASRYVEIILLVHFLVDAVKFGGVVWNVAMTSWEDHWEGVEA